MIFYQQLTRNFVVQLPFLMVYIAVLVLVIIRLKRYTQAATLAIVAMAVFILSSLLSMSAGYLPALLQGSAQLAGPVSVVIGYASLITGIISAAGWILLIAAVFAFRKPPALAETAPKQD